MWIVMSGTVNAQQKLIADLLHLDLKNLSKPPKDRPVDLDPKKRLRRPKAQVLHGWSAPIDLYLDLAWYQRKACWSFDVGLRVDLRWVDNAHLPCFVFRGSFCSQGKSEREIVMKEWFDLPSKAIQGNGCKLTRDTVWHLKRLFHIMSKRMTNPRST